MPSDQIVVYRSVFVGWGHDPTETFRVDSNINRCKIKQLATNEAKQMLQPGRRGHDPALRTDSTINYNLLNRFTIIEDQSAVQEQNILTVEVDEITEDRGVDVADVHQSDGLVILHQ